MTKSATEFPRVRACLFDMDGLLIDSEDKYTEITNAILQEFGKPLLPWEIKAQLQGRPQPEASKIFHHWAQLPISPEEYGAKQAALQAKYFPQSQPLPGVRTLLSKLLSTQKTDQPVYIALATSSHSKNFKLKTDHLQDLFSAFPESQRVLGDDPRIGKGRGKPLPDIYLLALETINEGLRQRGEPEIRPEECLVFEDAVPGVEAGRRAGMRVIWCPHPGLLGAYKGREAEVLAGLTGEHKEEEKSVPEKEAEELAAWRIKGGRGVGGKDTSPEEEKSSLVKDGEPCTPVSWTGPLMPLASKSSKVKTEEPSSPSFPNVSYTLSDPRSSPGHGAVEDPFSCYPIPVSHSDHELIQHFIVTYPSMMYKFADSVANNPMMEIFRQLALHDNLSFQAMLAIASKHRAGVEGKADSVQSLTHKMRALRLINERIHTDSQGLQDGTIYAVATMAVIEKWSRDASIERMHCMGLASMVRNRGGMRGMRASSPFLEKVLYWVDISCAPKAIYTSCLPWTGTVPDTSPESLDFLAPDVHLAIPPTQTAVGSFDSLCDQNRACEDFLRFFRCLHELEKAALGCPGTVSRSSPASRVRRFTPGAPLHSILTMLPDYDHGIRDIRFIDEYTCMSCLFFLAVALYDSYRNSTNFDRYLDWLDMEVQRLSPSTKPSITSVLWIFLNNGGYPQGEAGDAGERCWVVSRMVRIAKRLEWKRQGTIWDRLRQVLINFIFAQQECALGSDSVDEEAFIARQQRRRQSNEYFWDEDEMRVELLGSQPSSVLTPYPQLQTTTVA